jgi:small conductance mechanosensitive channel
MLRIALAIVVGFVVLSIAAVTYAQLDPRTITVQTNPPSQTTTATAEATTQPGVSVTVNTGATTQPAERVSIIDALSNTELGKMVRGEKQIDLTSLRNYEFWVTIVWDLTLTILAFIPRVIACFLFLAVFYLIYRMIRRIAVRGMKRNDVDTSIRDMIGGLLRWIIMGFGVVIACNQLGIPIVAMLTGVSIIGLAIGFAAQETLANFIAGIVIFLDRPFRVGDWIEVDGQQGAVKRVTFRSTRIVNLDGDVVVMPNTAMLSHRIVNKSTNPVTRVNVPISIAYKESIDKARDVLLATLKGDKRIETRPEPEIEVRQCGASSVDLMLHFWIREERYEDAMVWEYLERSKKALDAAGIEIPFPHMQVLLENTPAIAALAGDGKIARN